MSHVTASHEHFFVIRWGDPTPQDFLEVPRTVAELRERVGRPLVYLAVLPNEVGRIDDTARKGFTELTEQVLEHSEIVLIVFEARGFRGAMLRSALTAVTLLTRRRDTLKYLDSIATALTVAKDQLPADDAAVRAAIERTGSVAPERW